MKGLFMKNNFYEILKRFHNDENGANALETVMIIGIGVAVLAIIILWGKSIVTTAQEWWDSWSGADKSPIEGSE
jgi:Flp pilus assembly pilin Flp